MDKILDGKTAFEIRRSFRRKREFYRVLSKILAKGSEESSKAFDILFPEHNEVFCKRLAKCYEIITPIGFSSLQDRIPENYKFIFHLCSKGLNLLVGAYQTLRNGERTGSVAIQRQALECLSLALALWHEPEKFLPQFKEGKLSGEKLIGVAKGFVPFIGRLYGIFCDFFVHPSIHFVGKSMTPMHPMFPKGGRITIGTGYSPEHHAEFAQVLSYTQLMGMAYHAAIELMFWNLLDEEPHFWQKVEEKEGSDYGKFEISAGEHSFIEKFVDGLTVWNRVDNLKKWIDKYPLIKTAYETLKKEGVTFFSDIDDLKKAAKNHPKIAFLKYLIGEISFYKGDYEGATSYLSEYICEPDVPPFDAYFMLATVFDRKEQIATAVKFYSKGLECDPNSYSLLNNLGLLYDRIGEYDEAVKCFKKAQDVKPTYYNGALNEGNALSHKGEFDLAIEAYSRAAIYDKYEAAPLHNIGVAFVRKGDEEKAYAYFRKAILRDRSYLASWMNIGASDLKRNRLQRAELCLRRAFLLDPMNLIVNINLSKVYKYLGDIEKGLAFASRALELYPNDELAKENLKDIQS
jgi:tetratricopeptide (TPR) repeat protein